jgi:bifunctional DNA-binding transcriptional regulator/antitoxin component of YhaV-PrlF toxin-antitoxin module
MKKYEFNTKIPSDGIIILPDEMKEVIDHKVKIVLLDYEETDQVEKNNLKGILHHYADVSKIPQEKNAVMNALGKKNENY